MHSSLVRGTCLVASVALWLSFPPARLCADLIRAIGQLQVNSSSLRVPYTFDFIRAKSYEGTESTGKVTVTGVKLEELKGRHVVLVEDIIDTGKTMSILVPMMEEHCRSVRVASLLNKRNPAAVGFKAHYVGFDIPDKFVVGYNLDYNEAFREMDHICVINAKGIDAFKDFEAAAGTDADAAAAAQAGDQ